MLLRAGEARNLRTRGALWALLAAGIAILLVLVAASYAHWRQSRANSESYGSTIATQLAALAAGPLVTHDPLALNVITSNLSSAHAIRNVAIYTLDDRLINTGGRTSVDDTRDAPSDTVFVHAVSFEAQKIGYVRVVIDPSVFESTAAPLLIPAALAGVLFALWIGARAGAGVEARLIGLEARLRALAGAMRPAYEPTASALTRLAALAEDLEPAPVVATETTAAASPPYLLVLNLFNQGALSPRDRDEVYLACERCMAHVVELYRGRVLRLPGTGLVTLLTALEGDDHAFSAISAALLALRLTLALNDAREPLGKPRLGLRGGMARSRLAPTTAAAEDVLDELDAELSRVLTLSATANNGALAIDRAVFEALQNNHRVVWTAIRSPLADPSDGGRFHYQINGVAANQNALLDAQAEKLTARLADGLAD